MNALQLLKERELRVQLRNSSKKAVARGSESGDYTSAHLSPVKLAKEKVAPTQLKYRGVTYEAMRANCCLLYTSPSPRDQVVSRMPSSA